jgi:Domain of unknown function (DUF1989)
VTVASAGISLPVVPAPVNLFQNSGPQPDGRPLVGTAASRPGDAISFRLGSADLLVPGRRKRIIELRDRHRAQW